MVHDGKNMACPLQIYGVSFPQVDEFKYLRWAMEHKSERERCGCCIGKVLVKSFVKRLRSIDVPTFTYGQEIWVMNERWDYRCKWLKWVEMNWEKLGVEQLHQEDPAEVARPSVSDASWTPLWKSVLGPTRWKKELCLNRKLWVSLLTQTAASATQPWIKWKQMDGWKNV